MEIGTIFPIETGEEEGHEEIYICMHMEFNQSNFEAEAHCFTSLTQMSLDGSLSPCPFPPIDNPIALGLHCTCYTWQMSRRKNMSQFLVTHLIFQGTGEEENFWSSAASWKIESPLASFQLRFSSTDWFIFGQDRTEKDCATLATAGLPGQGELCIRAAALN